MAARQSTFNLWASRSTGASAFLVSTAVSIPPMYVGAAFGATDAVMLDIRWFFGVVGVILPVVALKRGVEPVGWPSYVSVARSGPAGDSRIDRREYHRAVAVVVGSVVLVVVAGVALLTGSSGVLYACAAVTLYIPLWFAWAFLAWRRRRRSRLVAS